MSKPNVLMVTPQLDHVQSQGGLGRAVFELTKHLRTDQSLDVRVLIPSRKQPPSGQQWQDLPDCNGNRKKQM